MSHKKICEWCGKEFEAKRSDAKICSTKCWGMKIRSAKQTTETCGWCSAVIVLKRKNKIFCSSKCSGAAYKKRNAEKVKAKQKEWRRSHPEKTKAQGARYRAKNQKKRSLIQAKYRKAHPEKRRANEARRRKNSRDKIKASKEKYYDSKGFLLTGRYTAEQIERLRQDPARLQAHRARRNERQRRCRQIRKREAARAAYLADPINAARIAEANYRRMSPEEKEKWHQKIEAEQEKADRKARREALRKELEAMNLTPGAIEEKLGETFADIEWAEPPKKKDDKDDKDKP